MCLMSTRRAPVRQAYVIRNGAELPHQAMKHQCPLLTDDRMGCYVDGHQCGYSNPSDCNKHLLHHVAQHTNQARLRVAPNRPSQFPSQ